ncbi:BON domain-containing protein [Pleionea sediminis]|uniref:BON domain-containing protein n=1 Tax=Pleionea sediminis TaxID=2569479 RepID=UPI0011850F8E|nr:BON domain-containing protein [Pleionea sediminis]
MELKKYLLITTLTIAITGCETIGQKGSSSNDLKQRDIATVIDDKGIELEAAQLIFKNDELWKNSEIDVTSFNKTILLTGQAPTRTLKEKAYQIVSKISGVKKVYNEIRVAAPTSSLAYLSDVSLSTKVRTALFVDDDLDSSKVKVVTEDGEVFLLGLMSQTEANKAVDITRNVSGVKRVIQAFEIIKK